METCVQCHTKFIDIIQCLLIRLYCLITYAILFPKCITEQNFVLHGQPARQVDYGLNVIPVSVMQITTQLLLPETPTSCSELTYISQHPPTHPDLPPDVSAGSFRSFWSEGALLEGVWVQAQLQWPRRHQMGAVHRPLRHLRNTLLKFNPARQRTDHFPPIYPVKIFFFSLFLLCLSPPLNPYSFSHTSLPPPSPLPN